MESHENAKSAFFIFMAPGDFKKWWFYFPVRDTLLADPPLQTGLFFLSKPILSLQNAGWFRRRCQPQNPLLLGAFQNFAFPALGPLVPGGGKLPAPNF